MSKLLVSFATRPGRGSEGGVGWEFLKGAALLCRSVNEKLFVILDSRDATNVSEELGKLSLREHVSMVPVDVPRPLLRIYGDRRTRQTYLGWLPEARLAAKRVIRHENIDVAHQITFATATLPSVVGALKNVKTVWGPINIPSSVVNRDGNRTPAFDDVRLTMMQSIGKFNARRLDTLVATNASTAHLLRNHAKTLHMEPNIIAEPVHETEADRADDLLTFSGGLIELKRPWIAVQAMRDPRLKKMRLQLIGDGPLRSSLESFTRQERIDDRVSFHGHLSKKEAIARVAKSRLLVHPSIREGASWVVGEAAAVGVAAVVFAGTGADSTVELCANGGVICTPDPARMVESYVAGIEQGLRNPQPAPSTRWTAQRLPGLINEWWSN